MLKIFGGGKSDHPMADLKEARRLLGELPANDAAGALDEINHWFESVRADQDFRPAHRAALALMLDETAQTPVRKLGREYLFTPRLSKPQENRLWSVIHGFWRNAKLAFVGSLEAFVTGAKGADELKGDLPLLTVRALRALAAQMKWLHMRYGPVDPQLWRMAAGSYSLAEARRYARTPVTVYPGVPGESTADQEFLRVLMLSASSPDSLLPAEIELCERLIGHFTPRFVLSTEPRGETPYWIDLAATSPPLRHARPPLELKTLRFFGPGDSIAEIDAIERSIQATGSVPSNLNLGGSYPPELVLRVLEHVGSYWAPTPLERKHPRHRVKSRLTVAWGFDGILDALSPGASLSFDGAQLESWITENVSAGGMGAHVPQVKGDWLRVGALVALQPDGGSNWLLGIVRRIARDRGGEAQVGIQTVSRAPQPVALRVLVGDTLSLDTELGILLGSDIPDGPLELLLRPGVHTTDQRLEFEQDGRKVVLVPGTVNERGSDYERLSCRQLVDPSG
ncbi:MAG: hypothetical protein WCE38_20630 [Burkholderiales bacterium]